MIADVTPTRSEPRVLAAGTGAGHLFPTDGAYTTAAVIGIATMAVTAITSVTLVIAV